MTIAIARVGSADVNSGDGGTNSTDTFTSASATWATGDYAIVAFWTYESSGADWTLGSLSASGGAIGTPTIIASATNTTVYPGYEGRVAFAAVEITTGFTGTITATRTPSGSSDHWTACNFYKLEADGAITFPDSATAVTTGDTNDDVTPDLGATPASSSALFAVASGDTGSYGAGFAPLTYPSGWTHHDDPDLSAWSNQSTALSSGYKIGSGTQTNTFTISSALSNGAGAIVALVVEIAEAGGGGPTAYTQNHAASLTPTGALTRRTSKPLAANSTPTAALTRRTGKPFTASATPSAALTRRAGKALAATTAATTTLVRATARNMAASSTPTTVLTKQVAKTMAASSTPTGAFTGIKVAVISLAASLTPSATLVRLTGKQLAASATPSATLVRRTNKQLAASATPTGVLTRRTNKTMASSTTATAALTVIKVAIINLAASVTPSAVLTKQVSKSLSASTQPTATLTRRTSKLMAASVTAAGALITTFLPGGPPTPTTGGPSSTARPFWWRPRRGGR